MGAMRQSFLIIYFVLYIVAIVSLLPAAGGGRIPCGRLADSLSVSLSERIAITAPRQVQLQLYRLRMGNMIVETEPRTTTLQVFTTGLVSPQERKEIAYQVLAEGKAPPLQCTTDTTTGVGLITHQFKDAGTFRYRITGEVRRHLPDKLPSCVKELLADLEGRMFRDTTEMEVIVAYDYIEPPLR
jgi:hypothetical protein